MGERLEPLLGRCGKLEDLFSPTFLTRLLVPGKYWGCMQRLATCPESWVPRVPGADAEEVEAVTALASLSVGILAEER